MTVVLGSITNPAVSVVPRVYGTDLAVLSTVTFSGNYATGGDLTLTPLLESLFKLTGRGTVEWVQVGGVPGYLVTYNYETGGLQVFESAASGAAFKEFTAGAYAGAITGAKARLFALGR